MQAIRAALLSACAASGSDTRSGTPTACRKSSAAFREARLYSPRTQTARGASGPQPESASWAREFAEECIGAHAERRRTAAPRPGTRRCTASKPFAIPPPVRCAPTTCRRDLRRRAQATHERTRSQCACSRPRSRVARGTAQSARSSSPRGGWLTRDRRTSATRIGDSSPPNKPRNGCLSAKWISLCQGFPSSCAPGCGGSGNSPNVGS